MIFLVKRVLIFVLILLLSDALNAQQRRLVWADEFNEDGMPDTSMWKYEEGFVRNREAQYYTRSRPENCRIENGFLILEARKDSLKNTQYIPLSDNWRESREYAEYTSASMYTLGKKQFYYGRIEIRAKIPQGKGVWPALWMMGINHDTVGNPACGEIDIMEFVGKDSSHVYGTAHFKPRERKLKFLHKKRDHQASGGKIKTVPYRDFHIYGIDWTSERIQFLYDGKVYHIFKVNKAGKGPDNPFRQPYYLLVNFALGGNWGGEIDASIFPQQMQIDYIRVYE